MENEFLDASSIDEIDEAELMGDYEDYGANPDPDPEKQEQQNQQNEKQEPSNTSDDIDFTTEVLKLKGISDPNKIKFEDEKSGAIIEKAWNDLTHEEQLNILTQEGNPDTDLDDDEIQLINDIRNSKMSIKDYIANLQYNAVQQAQASQPKTYEIDGLEDDELYALDLIEKVGEENITDEELREAIDKAKENPSLYAKQVEALRKQYKALEDENNLKAQQEQAAQEQEAYQNFSNVILNEIQGFNSIGGQEIELSSEDMNDLANFILTKDDSGVTDFGRLMNDPKSFTTVAFWALKGSDIMTELQEEIKQAYQRGYNEGKAPKQNTQSKLVFQPRQTPENKPAYNDAASAFGGDESYLNY